MWECGKDTVVGRVPALKLESGAKRREPEPKGRLGAARGCIPSALPKRDLLLNGTTNSTPPLLVRYLARSSAPPVCKDTASTVGSVDVRHARPARLLQRESGRKYTKKKKCAPSTGKGFCNKVPVKRKKEIQIF